MICWNRIVCVDPDNIRRTEDELGKDQWTVKKNVGEMRRKNAAMVGGWTKSSAVWGRQLGTCTLSRFRPLNPKTRCRPAIAKRRSPCRVLKDVLNWVLFPPTFFLEKRIEKNSNKFIQENQKRRDGSQVTTTRGRGVERMKSEMNFG